MAANPSHDRDVVPRNSTHEQASRPPAHGRTAMADQTAPRTPAVPYGTDFNRPNQYYNEDAPGSPPDVPERAPRGRSRYVNPSPACLCQYEKAEDCPKGIVLQIHRCAYAKICQQHRQQTPRNQTRALQAPWAGDMAQGEQGPSDPEYNQLQLARNRNRDPQAEAANRNGINGYEVPNLPGSYPSQ